MSQCICKALCQVKQSQSLYESIRSYLGVERLVFAVCTCIIDISCLWQGVAVVPCRQVWVLSHIYPPVAEPTLCQCWTSGPCWSVSQGDFPWQAVNVLLQIMHIFPLFSGELQQFIAQLSLMTEVMFVYLQIKHVPSRLGQALSRHMHGENCLSQLECCTDPSSVCLGHLDAVWKTARLAQHHQAATHVDMFLHLMSLDPLHCGAGGV